MSGRTTTLQEAAHRRRAMRARLRAGATHAEIARELGISRVTVTYYAKRKADEYPEDWPAVAQRIKAGAGWRCERCRHPHDRASGHVLTVHHLDGDKRNCADWNLAALCQRCHLSIQARVRMEQDFFGEILAVSEWFKPHLEGYLRARGNG